MAIMYPKNIELYNATASEKKVYKALESQLPDSFSVFYSVQWVDEINGKKKESECDFLIFSESDGFLTCEVKGGKSYKKVNDKFILEESDGERELKRSPMEQAEESSRYFYKLYMEEYNERFGGLYGSISFFPFYTVDDPVLLDHRAKDIVLDINDVDNLYVKIKKVFNFYKVKGFSGSLTKSQKANFKDLINKKIAARASAGSIIEAKEYELNNVNRIQDNFVYFLKKYPRTFITGGAGTGKTWIAYKFAKKAALEGKMVLVTTSNNHLIDFFGSLLKTYSNVIVKSYNDILEEDRVDNSLVSEVALLKYDSIKYKKYECIIVDEAQDFDQYQAMIISMHLLNEKSEFRVFYDFTQNIYDKDFKDGFDIQYPPFLLMENLRNTSSIYDWATDKTKLGKDVITNQIIGPLPIDYSFTKKSSAIQYIESEILKLVDKENVPIKEIILLLDHDCYEYLSGNELGRWKCVSFDSACDDDLKISLVEDYKGLESNIVFYFHKITTPENYNYVAYTRAKYYLFDIILKN